ncbi:MAG: sigma-54-dependent Fis family transcriptional regulator [Deltaproteobacteria bacterium]|nr:sigma-54-dependent Fis family transcriptional regulator [Deltaproteobacteria bacterium]
MTTSDRSSAVLLAVSEFLGREVAIDELLMTLVDRMATALEADRGTLYLVDRGKGEVFSRAAHLPEIHEIRLKMGQGIAGYVAESGETVNVPTTNQDKRFFAGVDEVTGYRTESILASPMRDRNGTVIGVVQLLNKRGGSFAREDGEVLNSLARQAASVIESTTVYTQLFRPPSEAREPLPLADRFNRIIGESEPMKLAYRLTTKAANSDATVLVRGESGTGKELFARAVHVNSRRKDKPFVKVDCAALPATLIENELFGHEKGAYTGADQRAAGKLDAAQGGTVFLDEIGELPLSVQGKLLRVLQDPEFERVGSTKTVQIDARIVAATTRDLEALVAQGRFRQDLYYRIKVVEIRLPSLRVRGPEDITRLARHFVAAAAKRHGRELPRICAEALTRLTAYPWPGNVRELENCLESAVVIMDGAQMLPEHLPLPERTRLSPDIAPDEGEERERMGRDEPVPAAAQGIRTLEEVERGHILSTLEQVGGNRSLAARLLGIGRNTLARKLRGYGL